MTQNYPIRNGCKAAIVAYLIAMVVLQQGCLAAAWLAAVGTDSMRTGDVRFEPFEHSWVSTEHPAAIVEGPALSSVAVMPIEGDEAMGGRLAKLFSTETALRVVTSTRAQPSMTTATAEHERAVLARQVSRELAVDAVLSGHVVGEAPQASDWGWKAQEPRRLFLYMIDRDGHLLWKDELPFLMVTGAKPALENSVQLSLTRHFMDHIRELGLDEAGYIPSKSS